MSRQDIRRMLWEPRQRFWQRPGMILAIMAAVLILGLGLGLGVGLGLWLGRSHPDAEAQQEWERGEMAVPRQAPRSDDTGLGETAPQETQAGVAAPKAPETAAEAEETADPVVAVPPQRPEGAEDDVEIAALPSAMVPLARPVPPGIPAWQRYAVASPRVGGRAMIAVVIDDLGVDRKRSERVTQLRPPLTLAFMTYAENLKSITTAARQRGHELMVHMPMQPQSGKFDPGTDVLEVGLSSADLRRRITWGLSRFDGFVGVNNHMGSRFTTDSAGMAVVMDELRARGLLFLDSVTTGKTVGAATAHAAGVPFASRDVFLDNEQSVAAVKAQLARAEALARKNGHAIAIGHPHDTTIQALTEWLPGLESRGVVLVPLTAIVRAQAEGGKPASVRY